MVFAPQTLTVRPRLLLVYADSAHAARVARFFRRLGWEVHMAPGALEARRLAEIYSPQAIVVEAAAAQRFLPHPGQQVILLAPERNDQAIDLLRSTGASALVARPDGMEGLVRAVYSSNLAPAI